MIRRLELKSFGKFKEKSFDLKRVTLFTGPNEAGKSTVFDALAKALCVFRGPQAFLERYGKEAEAKAVFSGTEEPKFDSTEYFGFFAVKSEAISVPFEGDARWMDRVKNSLFSGGVNPQVLAAELEKALNSSGRKRVEKERRASLAAAGSRVAALKGDLEAAENAKAGARDLKRRLDEASARVAALAKERAGLSRNREESEAGERYRYCLSVLKDREKLASLKSLRSLKDESGECRVLGKEAESARARAEAAATAGLDEAAAEAAARRREAETEAAAREREARVASGLCRSLEEASVLRETRRREPKAASYLSLTLSCLAGLACGAVFFALKAPFWAPPAAFVAGAAAGVVLFLALRKTIVSIDDAAARKAHADAKEEWRRLLPLSGELPGRDAAAALSFLRSVIDLGARAAERADESRAAQAKAEAAAASGAQRREALRIAAESSNAAYASWLSARGASSYEEYLSLVSESAMRESKMAEIAASLGERAEESGAEDLDDLAARAKDELDRLRGRWPGLEDRTAKADPAQSSRLKRIDADLDKAKEEEKALLAEYSTGRALAERDADSLLEDLCIAEREAESLRLASERDALQRDAESAARDVFLKMSESGSFAFSSLSSSVSAYYGSLGQDRRDLALSSLDLGAAMVPDANGTPRPPRHLSLGTRDIFVLACRLSLAESQRPRDGVLALDEPFKNLDRPRTRSALGILKDFSERNGYQILIFTKDESAAEDCAAVFPGEALAIYDLVPKE